MILNEDKSVSELKTDVYRGLDALCQIGKHYAIGTGGVKRNIDKALKCFRIAADLGYAKAQYCMFKCYLSGAGVTKDYDEAAKWCRRAADQGDADAKWCLSLLYCLGFGNP